NFVASKLAGSSLATKQAVWATAWWVHASLIVGFANLLPHSKHFHVITSIPNVFFRDLDGPKHLSTYKINMETGEVAPQAYGVAQITDFSWKDNLDFYTCTECGRCTDNCPAYLSGKPLSPKHLTVALRNHLYHNEKTLIAPKNGEAKNGEAKAAEAAE